MGGVFGDRELDAKLAELAGPIARKAGKAGVRAGMTPLVKALRAAVNASGAPTHVKRAARATIGKRFSKASSRSPGAKAGFAVGKKQTAASERTRNGVGISASNIHWFVLGTAERQTSKGKPTGRIAPLLGEVTERARDVSEEACLEAAREKIWEVISREAKG